MRETIEQISAGPAAYDWTVYDSDGKRVEAFNERYHPNAETLAMQKAEQLFRANECSKQVYVMRERCAACFFPGEVRPSNVRSYPEWRPDPNGVVERAPDDTAAEAPRKRKHSRR